MCPQCWISVPWGRGMWGTVPCPSSGCPWPRVGFFLAVASAGLSRGPERLAGVSSGLLTHVFPQTGIPLGNSLGMVNISSSLPEQEQYHFCYDIALEYLESLETR